MTVASTASSTVGKVKGAIDAADKAKSDGKTGWRMSAMGQLAASMLASAPIIGAGYGAYRGVTRADYNTPDSDSSSRSLPKDNTTPPDKNPQPPDNSTAAPDNTGKDGGSTGGGAVVGGGNTQPRGDNSVNNSKDFGKQGAQSSKDEQSSKDKVSGQPADQGASRETPKQYHLISRRNLYT